MQTDDNVFVRLIRLEHVSFDGERRIRALFSVTIDTDAFEWPITLPFSAQNYALAEREAWKAFHNLTDFLSSSTGEFQKGQAARHPGVR